jgi:manganese transport protein
VIFCRDRKLMGALTNRRLTTVAAVGVAAVIVCLNIFLLAQTFAGVF